MKEVRREREESEERAEMEVRPWEDSEGFGDGIFKNEGMA